jgi:cupin domain
VQKPNLFCQAALSLIVLGGSSCLFLGLARAEDSARFVRPAQATTYTDPVSKSQLKVLIDEKLGGTKDVTIADLVIPPGVDVPDHVHQSTEIFYILSGELEQTSEGKVQKLTAKWREISLPAPKARGVQRRGRNRMRPGSGSRAAANDGRGRNNLFNGCT